MYAVFDKNCSYPGTIKSMARQQNQIASLKMQAHKQLQANRLREAGELYHKACQLDPRDADAWHNVAYICLQLKNMRGAEVAARNAIAVNPKLPASYTVLGAALHSQHRYGEAIPVFEQGLQLKKKNPAVYNNLGNSYLEMGDPAEAIRCYRRAEKLKPEARYHSNLLMTLNYFEPENPTEVYEEHRRWGQQHGQPPKVKRKFGSIADVQRRLRIGYVSPDLREHPVACFLEPLLTSHDHDKFHITCYSAVASPDQTTARLRGLVDDWRNIFGEPDEQVIRQIRADGIDILVDLSGHTAGNRLKVFAQKPAPVQITYLGYPNTTGVPAIDYRLTDALTDPPGKSDRYHSEKLVRLPQGFLCYQPPANTPEVAPSPCVQNGYITFGSFNNLAKITPQVISTWAAILQELPDTRLLIKTRSFVDPGTRQQVQALLSEQGIDPARLELRGPNPSVAEHLRVYNEIDIALDTFPYNGTTTTCEALWMGVPVITRAGQTHAGRVGVSLLTQLQKEAWIAPDLQAYIAGAVTLAGRLSAKPPLARGPLRNAMAGSSLCNAAAFTKTIEEAYRKMWADWCSETAAKSQ